MYIPDGDFCLAAIAPVLGAFNKEKSTLSSRRMAEQANGPDVRRVSLVDENSFGGEKP